MKKLSLLISFMLCIMAIFSVGCSKPSSSENGEEPEPSAPIVYCSVTFVQEGVDDIVKSVEKGKGLTENEIPTPEPVTGYTVVWSITEFSTITTDLTVNAIATPNEYTIYIIYNAPESQRNVVSSTMPTEIKVNYDEKPVLPEYENAGYRISGWTYQDGTPYVSAKYNTVGDTTLKARWEYWTVNG